jgi:hypothetical protein
MMNAVTLGISSPKEAERTVRLLLHRARKPDELARFPLALALCAVFRCSDPPVALRRLVEDALPSHEDGTLRDLILQCDIDGLMTLREACARFAYSRRHFQRFRARAVSMIARRAATLVHAQTSDESLFALIA